MCAATGCQRVPGDRARGDTQRARVRAAYEARLVEKHGSPGPAVVVRMACQYERQLPVEVAMLFGHVVANDLPAEAFHPVAYAEAFLDGLFAGMKR